MIDTWHRRTGEHPRVIDAVAAVAAFVLFLLGCELTVSGSHEPDTGVGPRVILAAVSCLALLWQRTRPRAVVVATAVCAGAASGLGYLLTPLILAPVMLALFQLAQRTDRGTARVFTLAVLIQVVITAVFADTGHPLAYRTIAPAAWVLLPVVGGSAVRLRNAYLDAVRARAEHAERTREEEARHRVAEERVRIARELHDVVAHHLALANAQAGTAAHLARNGPEQIRGILTDLSGTTSSALRELKATVGLLRQVDDTEASSLEPAPGLARLDELTGACTAAGLAVDVVVEGEPRPLSAGVDLTAFRIVQEALTNVTKHAAAETARVRLAYGTDRLIVTVTDDGIGSTQTSPGHGFGLIGMRERAASVGGDVRTGDRPEGGFEVTAALPLHIRDLEDDRTP